MEILTQKTKKEITLKKPRFGYLDHVANNLLKEFGFPSPKIPLTSIVEKKGWLLEFSNCYGPDGYMVKIPIGYNKFAFAIKIATDIEKYKKCSSDTARRIRHFTLAHEIGHILLHGDYILNTNTTNKLDDNISSIMEVEANWFASRLVMPDYVFNHPSDLNPQYLADKCDVSLEAATKRIEKLNNKVLNRIKSNYKKVISLPLKKQDHIDIKGDKASMKQFIFPNTDESWRFTTCSVCGNDDFSNYASYCKKCGEYLFNECTNSECLKHNEGDAEYCEYCGTITIIGIKVTEFNQNKVPEIRDDDLPF